MEQKNGKNRIMADMVSPLLDWYAENARTLPWREDARPYYVWVSEIMLQQTRVEAVKEYFVRFVKELPDIRALAEVSEEKLLKLWEGLGYYSRARNLKKAAVVVMEQYGGRLPWKVEELLKLPGIGAYTAGAVASIAYGQAAAAVDGNVLRVMARLTGDDSDIGRQDVRKNLAKQLEAVMPKDFAGAFNQALMELGALVCLPNGKPLCAQCPVRKLCTAYREDSWERLPVKAAKKPRRRQERTVLLIETGKGFLVRKRPEEGLLAGLWEYPAAEGKKTEEEVRAIFGEKEGMAEKIVPLGEAKHIFSHIEWHMVGYYVKLREFLPQSEKMCFENGEVCGIMSARHYTRADSPSDRREDIFLGESCASPGGNMFEGHGIMKKDGLLAGCIPVAWEKLRADYSIPSAFEAYKNAVEKLGERQ